VGVTILEKYIRFRRVLLHMDEIQLIAQKRAFPSRGRARIHSNVLSDLEIEEGATIEIGVPDVEKWISATAFADSLVESGHIRLSEEDLKVLGASEGSKLRIRKKATMTEQIKGGVGKTGEAIKGGVSKTGETIKGTSAESIKAGASGAASSVSSGLGKAGHSVSAAFSNAYEAAKKKLKPSDAATLDKALKANKGEVRAVTIPTDSGTRQLSGI
jgi:hypothetical protein